jgi:type II secretion system protein G
MVERFRRKGFTLIELLIVVAIIAILAAIAVPNFLEAQVRAKVSRVKTDLRSIATAIEAYAVDVGDYPRNWIAGDQTITPDLTTPVAYLSTKNIYDPFGVYMERPGDCHIYGYHRIVPFLEALKFPFNSPWAPDGTAVDGVWGNPGALRKYGQWLLHSIGPDRVWWLWQGDWVSHDVLYDPTNGTVSFGNIVRTQLHPEGKILCPFP